MPDQDYTDATDGLADPYPNPYSDQTHTDFTLISRDGIKYHVSRFIIVWQSDVLLAAIGNDKCHELQLDEDSDDILPWLEEIHPIIGSGSCTERFNKDIKNKIHIILKMAHKYNTKQLLDRCDDYLMDKKTDYSNKLIELICNNKHFEKYEKFFISNSITYKIPEGCTCIPLKTWIAMHNYNLRYRYSNFEFFYHNNIPNELFNMRNTVPPRGHYLPSISHN